MQRVGLVLVLAMSALACTPAKLESPPVPDEEFVVGAAGVDLQVQRFGGVHGGPALVVLHGGPGLSHHYTAALHGLADSTRSVVTYDQRGVGRSTAPSDRARFALSDHQNDLEAIRLALGVERMQLLGHSWGGTVALSYTVAHPDRVTALVLVDSLPPTEASWSQGSQRFEVRRVLLSVMGRVPLMVPPSNGDDCAPGLLAVLPVYYFDPWHPATQNLGGTTCHARSKKDTQDAVSGFDLRAGMAGITVPTLVVDGAADPFGVQWGNELVAALSAAHPARATLTACGHLPFEECPERFYPRVRGFIDENR